MGIKDYIVPFVSGGITVVGVKVVGNFMSPQLAAVIGAFPLGMISSSTIKNVDRFKLYLHNYPIMLSCLLIAMGVYRFNVERVGMERSQALRRAIGTWAGLAIVAMQTVMRGAPATPQSSS